jgi:hypothetical protein
MSGSSGFGFGTLLGPEKTPEGWVVLWLLPVGSSNALRVWGGGVRGGRVCGCVLSVA